MIKAWIKRAWCKWKFNRLSYVDKEMMRYLEIDPKSLIKRGEL